MQVKLLLVIFYVNDELHAVSIGKPSELISNFLTVRFLKTELESNFGFPQIPITYGLVTQYCQYCEVITRH